MLLLAFQKCCYIIVFITVDLNQEFIQNVVDGAFWPSPYQTARVYCVSFVITTTQISK